MCLHGPLWFLKVALFLRLIVLLDQFLDHVANLMPDMMLVIQHARLVEIELAIGGILPGMFLKTLREGQRFFSSIV